jgi:Formin Homology 2 Domain
MIVLDLEGSLWSNDAAEAGDDDIIDHGEFNDLFVVDQTKRAASITIVETPVIAKEKTKRKLSLIDTKRDNGGNIALRQIKVPINEIRKSVEEFDTKKFNGDQLSILHDYLPSEEESNILAPYRDEFDTMSMVERYMLSMDSFQTASARLKCLMFKDGHKTRLADVTGNLRVIDNACDDVKMSLGLKKVLKTILRVGNQMNDAEKVLSIYH